MWLLPLSRADAERIIRRSYSIASDHARKVGARVEPLAPKHIYGGDADKYGYSLALGRINPPLTEASLVVIWGFYNYDEYFDYVRFVEGGRAVEWFVEPIAYYPEKVAVWIDEPLVFRSGFSIETHTTSSEQRDRVYGWPLGFAVLPRQPPPRPRGRRGARGETRAGEPQA
ncbi:hypothetical protein B7L68_02965 [Thermoproteus sp. CP80]|jgi:hypothetical protein|uniref:hypothetical protein n=1 Tax=Thermoproteus sp. CP80 TaxID=1650659 RepID=UPI0009BFBA16|nr:hypothetical protein [Thermoproteus sp. CP80]PLC65735.1 hypothetical protein B7L68_02965 [Thermoproteus sp. CP80]